MPRPVVIDTDLGSDIDDSWALAMALRSPELDVRLVIASTGDPLYRAALAADLLAAAGADHIPIGLGLPGHANPSEPLRPLADPRVLSAHPGGVHDGVIALIDVIETHARSASGTSGIPGDSGTAGTSGLGGSGTPGTAGTPRPAGTSDGSGDPGHLGLSGTSGTDAASSPDEPVTVIALGPLTTIAAAVEQRPDVMARARLVGMQGSLRVGYWGIPGAVVEYNVTMDVAAARTVFGTPWSCTVAPLDTTATVQLQGERYQAVGKAAATDPLLATLLRQQRMWLDEKGRSEQFEQETSVLHDTVAVHLAYDETLVEIEELGISLSPYGLMSVSTEAPSVRLATRWRDQDRFLDDLVDRLLGRATAAPAG